MIEKAYNTPDLSVEKSKVFYRGYYGIDQPYYLTGQEHLMMGSTPRILKAPPQWYIPQAVLSEDITIEEASRIRSQIGYYTAGSFAAALINIPHCTLALSLEPLNPKNGITLRDPQILGVLYNTHRRIVRIKGRDLTSEYRWVCQSYEDPKDPFSLFHFR